MRTSQGAIPRLEKNKHELGDESNRIRRLYTESLTVLVEDEEKFDFPVQLLTEIREDVNKLKEELKWTSEYLEDQKRYVHAKSTEVQELVRAKHM